MTINAIAIPEEMQHLTGLPVWNYAAEPYETIGLAGIKFQHTPISPAAAWQSCWSECRPTHREECPRIVCLDTHWEDCQCGECDGQCPIAHTDYCRDVAKREVWLRVAQQTPLCLYCYRLAAADSEVCERHSQEAI